MIDVNVSVNRRQTIQDGMMAVHALAVVPRVWWFQSFAEKHA